ncbi:DctP family TRAP transporter solute-binding subunit [Solibacillus sp. FSL W7-1472]|uniref:DctP family TRAP transporter solute-binding subunit n=1 Tax=Solibacillus sp. FSL W7-1472 TaxID=2921707 RepID=UPI0030DDB720
MKKLKLLLLTLGIIILAACGDEGTSIETSASGEQVYKLKVAHSSAATDDRLENSLQEFKKSIEEKSNGRIIIETYPNSQLGAERETLEGVQNGSIEMAVISTGPFSGFSKSMMVLDLPYLFKNGEEAFEVLDGDFGDKLFDNLLEETGLRGLAWGENGVRHMANNSRKIVTPEDVEGLKIRTQENQAHMDMIKAFGGGPTPIAFNELYSSLQQGVIDGYENPFSLIVGMKFYEVTKHLTLTSHVYGVYGFVINDDVYSSLPADLQELLEEETDKWAVIEREMNQQQEEAGRKVMEEHGVEITELTDEQYNAFRDLAAPVVESYRDVVGADVYDLLMEKLEAYK